MNKKHKVSAFNLKTDRLHHSWSILPEELLLNVFGFLDYVDLIHVGEVCWSWKEAANNELLWKRIFLYNHQIESNIKIRQGAVSWQSEYKRLQDQVPCVELENIFEHEDEVLHVAFSNNGMLFSTCSKDAFIKVFDADWPFETLFSEYLGDYNSVICWEYTQFSQFSPCDTQLLVSGRRRGSEMGGEIVIYNIFRKKFTIQARVEIRPYDVMGTWINDSHILSGRAHNTQIHAHLCEVVLNKSSQVVEDFHQSTMTRLFLFRCNNYATVSYLQVADLCKPMQQAIRNCSGDLSKDIHSMHYNNLKKHNCQELLKSKNEGVDACKCNNKNNLSNENSKRIKLLNQSRGNPNQSPSCFSFCSKKQKCEENLVDDPNLLLKSCGVQSTDSDSVNEIPLQSSASTQLSPSTSDANICRNCGKVVVISKSNSAYSTEVDSSSTTSPDEDFCGLPNHYKIMLCFTGYLVGMPHQIGVKLLREEVCSKVENRDIKTTVEHLNDRHEVKADDWDHILELRGQCVGMNISPCNRYLYVNVRAWKRDILENGEEIPILLDISTKIELIVFDLIKMERISVLTGHSAVSDVFFLHLSSNDNYISSGSEDSRGYIWDRHYNCCVASLPHDDVVNCVALNPKDPSMAVSVSDDHSVKIWRSKSFHRLYQGARAKARWKKV